MPQKDWMTALLLSIFLAASESTASTSATRASGS